MPSSTQAAHTKSSEKSEIKIIPAALSKNVPNRDSKDSESKVFFSLFHVIVRVISVPTVDF